jgi:hypothetical protein
MCIMAIMMVICTDLSNIKWDDEIHKETDSQAHPEPLCRTSSNSQGNTMGLLLNKPNQPG